MTMFAQLQAIGADSPELCTKLKGMFLDQAPEHLTNIGQAIEQQEADTAKKVTHTFKGVCLNLGADDMGKTCKAIEEAWLANDFAQAKTLHDTLQTQFNEAKAFLATL